MRKPLSFVLATALFAVAAAPQVASAQPNVRDHRKNPPPPAMTGPTEAPPAIREERPGAPRRGYVWVEGDWDWKGGKWVWEAGHYERRQKGKEWGRGKWEQRDGRWERVRGWRDAPKEQPAPPEPYAETPQFRRGHVWVKGRWEWDANAWAYEWVPGKLERRQRGRQWQEGAWANSGGRWTWNAGIWIEAPKVQPAPPEPPREERQFRRGSTWIPGHWEWDANAFAYEWVPGKLERRQKGKRFRAGTWANNNGVWQFTPGRWDDGPKEPDVPPPLLEEKITERKGYIWARGYWMWADGEYEWVPGHYEKERPGQRYINGEWGNVNSKWTFTPGRWQ